MDIQQEATRRETRPALAKETRANTSVSVKKENWPLLGTASARSTKLPLLLQGLGTQCSS